METKNYYDELHKKRLYDETVKTIKLDDLLQYADGKSELNNSFDREGVVIRTLDRTISFKVISNKFLLNEK